MEKMSQWFTDELLVTKLATSAIQLTSLANHEARFESLGGDYQAQGRETEQGQEANRTADYMT